MRCARRRQDKMSSKKEKAIRRGSANIFADLGFADAETHLLKAELVSRVIDIIADSKLNQTAAAKCADRRRMYRTAIATLACSLTATPENRTKSRKKVINRSETTTLFGVWPE